VVAVCGCDCRGEKVSVNVVGLATVLVGLRRVGLRATQMYYIIIRVHPVLRNDKKNIWP
jgi:hypothetical protein